MPRERVSLVRCAVSSSDEEIARRTQDAIAMVGDLGPKVRAARTIAVKINAGIPRVVLTDGRQTELTEPAVVEGVLRALREVTGAEILVGDAPTSGDAAELYQSLGYPDRLAKYPGVRLVNFGEGELVDVPMTHPGAMFSQYRVSRLLAEADCFVSVAKMKAHVGMGCTLCIKNLFGWTPTSVYGAPRSYLHDRLIRLPRVLADLAAWTKPCLNVVDAIVAANMSEWRGVPMRPEVIIAGTNVVATDSVGARVMGIDPSSDYPAHPFFYRRNAILLASQLGVGPVDPALIDVLGLCPEDVSLPFTVNAYNGESSRGEELKQGLDCVEAYRANQANLADRYAGRLLAVRDGNVLWDGEHVAEMIARERESGLDWKTAPQLMVRCVPHAQEIENWNWYDVDAAMLTAA